MVNGQISPVWWQDYRHLRTGRQLGSTNDSGVTGRYTQYLSLLDEFNLCLPRLWLHCFQGFIFACFLPVNCYLY